MIKVGMIKDVVKLEAQLELQSLGKIRVLEDGEVQLTERRPDERVPTFVTEMARARSTGQGGALETGSHWGARDGERS